MTKCSRCQRRVKYAANLARECEVTDNFQTGVRRVYPEGSPICRECRRAFVFSATAGANGLVGYENGRHIWTDTREPFLKEAPK